MSPSAFSEYVSVCALLLARAHAQSVNASMLHGYVGNNATVRQAVIDWFVIWVGVLIAFVALLKRWSAAADSAVRWGPPRRELRS